MNEVYIVWNSFAYEDWDGSEILEIWTTKEEAESFLDNHVSGMPGDWIGNHSTFSAVCDAGLQSDIYYVQTHTVSGKG